jgi:tape measure domain-containing protein
MAKLGDLVVRIGADTRDLNKSLGKVQRNMRSMTSNFTALGTQMTKAVTLPILGIGAMAIKSAADLEKMEVSFISLTGGAKQAGDMMQQLNEFTAKTPFQIDAVATSARQLIASGTGIGEVNEQLQFLGDIAATTGQPINEIAAIFAKVNAKGKVELENLNQLAERGIPVFKGLADATGLLPSELGAGAVTVKQFNDYLKSLSEEGGMANGAMERLSETATGKFSTALDNLKLAGAALAEDLLPIISDLLDYVVDLAQSFTRLSPETKKIILIMGGLAAAIGPLLIIVPKLIAGFGAVSGALGVMAGPIGWAVLGIAAITAGMLALDKANNSSKTSIEKATKVAREQSAEVRYLVGQYKDEKKSLEDRERILKRLQEIDSTHFSNLDAENTKYSDLVTNLNAYTNALRKTYLEKSFAAEGEALFGQLAEDESAIREREIMLQRMQDVVDNAGDLTRKAAQKNLADEKYFYEQDKEQRDKTLDLIEDFEKRKLDILNKYASLTPDVIDPPDPGSKGDPVVPLERMGAAMEMLTPLAPKLAMQWGAGMKSLQTSTSTVADTIVKDFDEIIRKGWELTDSINDAISSAAQSMVSGTAAMIGAAIATKEPVRGLGTMLLGTFADLAINLGNIAIGIGVTIKAIKASLESLHWALALAAGIALVALGAGLKGIIAKGAENAGVPLAEGGLIYGPTRAIVGDNRNAHIDPEVVAPLSKLKKMMGGNAVQVYGRISGDDIVISNSRASRDRNRF